MLVVWVLLSTQEPPNELPERHARAVRPRLEAGCVRCHNPQKKKGGVDLASAKLDDRRLWRRAVEQLESGTMPPEDEPKLADWLAAFLGRGSDLDVPVRELPRMYAALKAPPGVTDLIFVTDAKCRMSTEIKKCFLNWKAFARARLVTLVIDNPPGDLAHVSDEVHAVRSLAPDSDAVGRVLSL